MRSHEPVPEGLLAHGTHQPGQMKIVRRHQQAGGGGRQGRRRPEGQPDAERQIGQGAEFPAEFFGQGIALQHQVGRGHPGAEEIRPAAKQEQRHHAKVGGNSRKKARPRSFLAVNLPGRLELGFGDAVAAVRGRRSGRSRSDSPRGRPRRPAPPESTACRRRNQRRCP